MQCSSHSYGYTKKKVEIFERQHTFFFIRKFIGALKNHRWRYKYTGIIKNAGVEHLSKRPLRRTKQCLHNMFCNSRYFYYFYYYYSLESWVMLYNLYKNVFLKLCFCIHSQNKMQWFVLQSGILCFIGIN